MAAWWPVKAVPTFKATSLDRTFFIRFSCCSWFQKDVKEKALWEGKHHNESKYCDKKRKIVQMGDLSLKNFPWLKQTPTALLDVNSYLTTLCVQHCPFFVLLDKLPCVLYITYYSIYIILTHSFRPLLSSLSDFARCPCCKTTDWFHHSTDLSFTNLHY